MAEGRPHGASIQAVLAVAEATREAVKTVQDQIAKQGDKIAATREEMAAIVAKLSSLEKTAGELYRAVHQGNGVPSILMRLSSIEAIAGDTDKRCDAIKARTDRVKFETLRGKVAIWCAGIAAVASVVSTIIMARISKG
jgi:hypothetical protein